MDERTTNEVVQDVMDDIAAKREATQETAKEEKTLADQFADSKAEQAQPEGTEDGQKKMDEITLKFGKGCVGDEFQGKDGVKYKEILVPNQDKDDHRPWQTFVVKATLLCMCFPMRISLMELPRFWTLKQWKIFPRSWAAISWFYLQVSMRPSFCP